MMKYDVKDCKLLQKRELAKDIFDFVVEAPDFAAAAQAGQFALWMFCRMVQDAE